MHQKIQYCPTWPTCSCLCSQLSLTESEISKIGSIKVEGIINPTNAEMDLKDGVGKEDVVLCASPLVSELQVIFSRCALVSGNALEKAGGREFLDGVKELRKAQGPLEVASGTRWPRKMDFYQPCCLSGTQSFWTSSAHWNDGNLSSVQIFKEKWLVQKQVQYSECWFSVPTAVFLCLLYFSKYLIFVFSYPLLFGTF